MSHSSTALQSARELLAEASLQYTDGQLARAYGLAAASIEQTEIGLLEFEGENGPLPEAGANANRLVGIQSHDRNVRFLYADLIRNNRNLRETISTAFDLMMYVTRQSNQLTSRKAGPLRPIVGEEAARTCVALAKSRLADALSRIAAPRFVTRFHDRLFAMDVRQFQRILATDDFWWYYIARLQSGRQDWAEAVLDYDVHFFAASTLFKALQA